MKCSCPKCAAQIEMDLANLGESGASVNCSACKARLLISRESFSRRAYRKEGQIACAACGNALGHALHCPSCGVLYPDYFMAETPDAARKKAKKTSKILANLKQYSFEWRPAAAPSQGYTPKQAPLVSSKKSTVGTRRFLVMAVCLVLVSLLSAGSVMAYRHHKAEKRYASDFIKAFYVVKVGTDLNLGMCEKIANDRKSKMAEGRISEKRLGTEEELKLTKVQGEIDRLREKINQPPEKFIKANEKLIKLYGVYTKSHALAVTPPDSLASLTDSSGKAASDFKLAIEDLKANLPKELSVELEKAKLKFSGLRDI